MKKQFCFLFFCLAFLGTTVHAQLKKGTLLLNGDPILANNTGGLWSLNVVGGGIIYSFTPSLGYFVSDRLMIQGSMNFFGLSVSDESFSDFAMEAGARFYLNPENPKNNFFLEARPYWAGFGFEDVSVNEFGYNAGVGSTHFLAPGVSFDTRLLFRSPFPGQDNLVRGRGLSLGTGLNFYLNPEMKAGGKSIVPALQKGKWMIGGSNGSISFNFNPDVFGLSLSPTFGYFVSDRFVTGAQVGMSYQRVEGLLSEYDKITTVNFAPMIRYYLGKNTRMRWFAGSSLVYAFSSVNNDIGKVKDSTVSWDINAGFNLFLTPNFALESGANFRTDFDEPFGGLSMGFNYFIR